MARIKVGGKYYSAEFSTLGGQAEYAGSRREMLDLLRAYYLNNGLYDVLRAALYAVGAEADELRPLRNPANRVVEFYAARLWPGTLPRALPFAEGVSDAVAEAVKQVWKWSNWSAQKQRMARWQALYGNVFIKVVGGDPDKVYLQLIDPRHVVDFDVDEEGFVQYIRLDVQQVERNAKGVPVPYIYTEVWDKGAGTFAVYKNDIGYGAGASQLGDPVVFGDIEEAFGIDFVPVVWVPHRDIGEDWGVGAFELSLDKIDEANRQATRLHALLFRNNRALWAIGANATDAQGRPVPAPLLGDLNSDEELDMSGDKAVRLPGMSKIESLVPPLKYAEALAVVNAQMAELEADMPELAYYRLREQSSLSGRALRLLLSDAIGRLLEARGNAEAGLIRAQMMALTIGQGLGLPGFGADVIGTYDAGAFAMEFAERAVFPLSAGERAETVNKLVISTVPLRSAMRIAGYTPEQIAMVAEDKALEANEAAALLAQARRDTGEI